MAWSNGGALYARRFQEGSWLTWDQVYSYGGGPASVSLLDAGMSSSGQAALLFTVTPYVGPPPSLWVAWWYGDSWSTSQIAGPSASLGGGSLGVCVSGNTYLRVAYVDGSSVTEVPAMLSGGSLMPAGSTTLSSRGTTVAPVLKVVGLNCASLAIMLHGSSLWAARAGASMSSWESEQQISSGDTVSAAAGAIDATGSAAVLYSCASGCGVRMVALPGSGQPSSPLSASDQSGAGEPDVAADGTGRFLAVFSQTISGTQGIWAGEFTPPVTLTPSHAIGSTLGSSCSTPSAGYASGIGYAAWVRTYTSTGYRKIEGALYDSGVK